MYDTGKTVFIAISIMALAAITWESIASIMKTSATQDTQRRCIAQRGNWVRVSGGNHIAEYGCQFSITRPAP